MSTPSTRPAPSSSPARRRQTIVATTIGNGLESVSYTHLTLPTKRIV